MLLPEGSDGKEPQEEGGNEQISNKQGHAPQQAAEVDMEPELNLEGVPEQDVHSKAAGPER